MLVRDLVAGIDAVVFLRRLYLLKASFHYEPILFMGEVNWNVGVLILA
jgi:hypothetical protein